MSMRILKQIDDGHVKMEKTKTNLCGYVRTNILVEGKIKVMCEFRDTKQKSELHVAKTDSKAVLSLQTCRELEMTQILNQVTSKEGDKKQNDGTSMESAYIEKKIKMIAGKSGKEPKQTIKKMYPNLFKDLEKIEPEHHIKLKEDISPKVHPSRKICASSWAKIRKIKKELDRMEKADDHVIRKIEESTEWVNSIVVVEKQSGRLIICLDPRDLNKAIKREDYQLPIFEEITSRLSGV